MHVTNIIGAVGPLFFCGRTVTFKQLDLDICRVGST